MNNYLKGTIIVLTALANSSHAQVAAKFVGVNRNDAITVYEDNGRISAVPSYGYSGPQQYGDGKSYSCVILASTDVCVLDCPERFDNVKLPNGKMLYVYRDNKISGSWIFVNSYFGKTVKGEKVETSRNFVVWNREDGVTSFGTMSSTGYSVSNLYVKYSSGGLFVNSKSCQLE